LSIRREFRFNNNPILPQKLGIKNAVYCIIAKQKNNLPIKINRLAAVDKNGILYIGKTDRGLNSRLNQFNITLANKHYNTHSGASLLTEWKNKTKTT